MNDSKNPLGDAYIMGIEAETYRALLEIARQESKSVADVTSEALRRYIVDKAKMTESTERRVLVG